MTYLIRIIGLADGERTPFDGKWLQRYDPDEEGVDPNGDPMTALVECTDDPEEAMAFLDKVQAIECWRQQAKPPNHLRLDGKPNRPLTAFSIEIVPPPAVPAE